MDDNDINVNPAWNDVLELIPEDVREQALPHFQNWDQNFKNKVQEVHSEWEPYGFLKENEISPEDARVALGVMRAVQENPRAVYDSLAETYDFSQNQDPESGQGDTESDANGIPGAFQQKFEELQRNHNAMAEILIQQKREREDAEADAKVQSELDQLRKQHGSFDEEFVVTHMLNGSKPEDAIQAYQSLTERIKSEMNRPKPPVLLGSDGGGIPGERKLDVTKMSEKEADSLVNNWLAARARMSQEA